MIYLRLPQRLLKPITDFTFMSLKAFHLIFVICTTLFCLFMGIWTGRQWLAGETGSQWQLLYAILSFAGTSHPGLRLLFSEEAERSELPLMQRLTTFLAVCFLAVAQSPSLMACATCYGQSDSKLAEGMNWGILTLMVVVYGVLMGIAGFFGYIIYRSHRLSLAAEAQESAQESSESSADTTH